MGDFVEPAETVGPQTNASGSVPVRAELPGDEDLRPEISVSWWRSQVLGVKPDFRPEAVPSEELLDADERLRRGLQPVMDDLVAKLAGTNSAIILADHRAVILDRRATHKGLNAEMDRLAIFSGSGFGEACVGTNGIGTAAEERRLVRVAGAEHYGEIFKHLYCYGVPLIHPLNRRLMGVLDLCGPRAEEHPLMYSFMEDTGRRVEGLLAEWSSLRERAQFECFLELSRRSRRAVLCTMDDSVLLNRWARELNPVDQAALLRTASEAANAGHGAVFNLAVTGREEPVSVRVYTKTEQARFQGVILEILPSTPRRTGRSAAPAALPDLVGGSAAWIAFCTRARAASQGGVPILLSGEAGTGKLAAARALHGLTDRTQLQVVDAATVLTDGKEHWLQSLRAALDDGDSTVVIRHLEVVDPGLGAAIAAELDAVPTCGANIVGTLTMVAGSAGHQTLHDRFCVQLAVPPLRDRTDDVEALVNHFVKRHAAGTSLRFHPSTLAKIRSMNFSGNVRELETLIKGITATRRAGDVLPSDLPDSARSQPSHLTPMERAEREAIVKALAEAKGNKASAAGALGISRPTLYRKIAIYGIDET